jgi:hypothetical protein
MSKGAGQASNQAVFRSARHTTAASRCAPDIIIPTRFLRGARTVRSHRFGAQRRAAGPSLRAGADRRADKLAADSQERESSESPMLNAFWRVAPSLLLSFLAICDALVFLRAIVFSSRTSPEVHARRFFVLFAIKPPFRERQLVALTGVKEKSNRWMGIVLAAEPWPRNRTGEFHRVADTAVKLTNAWLDRSRCGDKMEIIPAAASRSALTIVKGPPAILKFVSRRIELDADYFPELPVRRRLHDGAVGRRLGKRHARLDDPARRRDSAARGVLKARAAAMRPAFIAALIFLLLIATETTLLAQTALPACPAPQQAKQVAELLFGRNAGGRLSVSEAAWARFVARALTPRFPDGLTISDASGQWRDPGSGTIMREPVKRVEIVLPGNADDQARLDAVVSAYKQEFHQRSVVVIVQEPACRSRAK